MKQALKKSVLQGVLEKGAQRAMSNKHCAQ